jgi:hypothetical protein
MSEYQYYEFRAVDRPLGEREMVELRELSTRAEITPTGFVNTYNWGDFRGDPYELMEKYFDAFVYVANWGTHRFMLRVPRRLLDTKAASLYCTGEELSLRAKGEHVLLEFVSDPEEPEDFVVGGEGWLPSMITLRSDLLRGDLRSLYLGWLACLWTEELDDDAPACAAEAARDAAQALAPRVAAMARRRPDRVSFVASPRIWMNLRLRAAFHVTGRGRPTAPRDAGRERHARKSTLIERLRKAGLVP